jgi:hypothetical protein
MEMQIINILINCISVLLHILSMITSICLFALIVYRWNFNRHRRKRISIISVSLFDNSISLLLIANTYLIFIVYSATWLSILIHTVAGDFAIFETFLYLGDSIACRVRVAMIFFLTSAMFHSFLLQALWCFFKVIFHSTLHTKKLCYFSLDHVFTYILLILTSWLVSILTVIPAFTTFNVFSYFPEQYHCLISFTNVRGFVYSLLSTYIIPVLVIIFIYSRLINFIHYAFNFNHTSRARREIKIVKRILAICAILSFSGFPTIFFLVQFIITGRLHPLADRIHELGLAINTNIVILSFAILNSFIKLLPTRSAVHR